MNKFFILVVKLFRSNDIFILLICGVNHTPMIILLMNLTEVILEASFIRYEYKLRKKKEIKEQKSEIKIQKTNLWNTIYNYIFRHLIVHLNVRYGYYLCKV